LSNDEKDSDLDTIKENEFESPHRKTVYDNLNRKEKEVITVESFNKKVDESKSMML